LILQAFFTDRLLRQRQASPHTIAAYRDTLRLLLDFAAGPRANRNHEHLSARRSCHQRARARADDTFYTVRPVATGRLTFSWLFSRRFDYADSIAAITTYNRVGNGMSA